VSGSRKCDYPKNDGQARRMTSVRKATVEDFDHVFPLFSGFATHTQVDPSDWRKIFTPLWSQKNEPFGFILEDGQNPVGFLGTLFSERKINGKDHLFCNLTSWIVKPEYRNESLNLLFPLLGRKGLTITNFTASNRVVDVLLKLGFNDLEKNFRIILPLPVPGSRIRILDDLSVIHKRLDASNQRILDDHATLHCVQVLITCDNAQCYLVLNHAVKKGRPVFFMNYLSNLEFFITHYQALAYPLCRKYSLSGIMVGDHTLKGHRLPLTLHIPRKHSLLFHSKDVKAEEIDTLYSEIQVLGLKPV
jgi:hypothetical protein